MRFNVILLAVGMVLAAAISFDACSPASKGGLSPEETSFFLGKGEQIALETFSTLSGNLQSAIQVGGVPYAIQYCQTAASPLTDSVSTRYGVSVKRTSQQVRNPANAPDLFEEAALLRFDSLLAKGDLPSPYVSLIGLDTVAFYGGIFTQPACLQCHGQLNVDLTEENYALINSLYPDDQATGYLSGEWRGIWSIRMPRGMKK